MSNHSYYDFIYKVDGETVKLRPEKIFEPKCVYLIIDKDLKLIDFTYFENVKDVQNAYITTGVVATEKLVDKTVEKNGIILDIPIAKDSSYMTQILYFEDGKIKKAFEDEDERLIKPYYIPVEDINDDKVIEIPMIPGSGNAYTSKSSANVSWYRWNGEN